MDYEQIAQLKAEMSDFIDEIADRITDVIGDRDIIERLGLPTDTDSDFTKSEAQIRGELVRMITEKVAG